MSGVELVRLVRADLLAAASPSSAPRMQAYMKSTMPFLGVRVPVVRDLVRRRVREHPPLSAPSLHETVRTLWREATHREERYASAAVLGTPAAYRLREPALITLLADLIVDGAWWDHVDELSHRVGDLLRAYPDEVEPVVVGWQTDPDHWLRRASIICQLGHRGETDLELLSAAIEASIDEPDFFLRKAIGWALRDYARTDPEWVQTFVDTHALSPLSRREALKHL